MQKGDILDKWNQEDGEDGGLKPGAADHPPYKQLSHYKQTPAEEVPGRGQEQRLYIIALSGVSCWGGDIDVYKQADLGQERKTELGWGTGGSSGQVPGAAEMFGVPATMVLEKMTPGGS